MSIKVTDFKKVKVNDLWVEKGTEYAQKSWPYTYNRMASKDIYKRLRNIVKGIIAQESLGYILNDLGISYETKPKERWYDVNRFDYLVNVSKEELIIDIKGFFVSKDDDLYKKQGSNYFLDCYALVPVDQMEGREMKSNDIYVFAFIVGRENKLTVEYSYCIKPKWLLHCFWEYEFFKPPKYINEKGDMPLGKIELKSSYKNAGMEFVLGGTTKPKDMCFETIKLNNEGRGASKKEFFQLFFIRSVKNELPLDNINVTTESGESIYIPAIYGFKNPENNGWGDIWIYDVEIYFVGFSTKEYFKTNSEKIGRFAKLKQFETKTDNYGIIVRDLPYPIDNLTNFLKR